MADAELVKAWKAFNDEWKKITQFGVNPGDVMAMTQFGWPGQRSYNDAKSQLNKVNTPHGTIDNQGLGPNNKMPTQDEAVQMIDGIGRESGENRGRARTGQR